MLKNQEVGVDNKMITLNKIQVKGNLDMFRRREMILKIPNLIKKDINRPEKVQINNKDLINLIVGDRIEVDNNNVVVMKVVVVVMKVVVEPMKVVVVVMKVVVEAIRILIVTANSTKIISK